MGSIRKFNYIVEDNEKILCCEECTSFLNLPIEIKNRENDINWVVCNDCREDII